MARALERARKLHNQVFCPEPKAAKKHGDLHSDCFVAIHVNKRIFIFVFFSNIIQMFMEGENKEKKHPKTAGSLEEALSSLINETSFPSEQPLFDAETILPAPNPEESEAQPPTTELSFTERINLEESLLEKAGPEVHEIAADSLVTIADSGGCSIVHIRRILDILTHYNKEAGGKLSGQLRKVKRHFDYVLGRPLEDEDPEFSRRDTLPFPGKMLISGAPRQVPQSSKVDTTEKIHKGKAKR
jgi:hypothetical protein